MAKIKRLLVNYQQVALLLVLLGLGSQCTQRGVDKQGGGLCRLVKIDLTSVTSGSIVTPETMTGQTLYTYDAEGRLEKKTDQKENKSAGYIGGSSQYTLLENYVYDTGGFLTGKQRTEQWKDGKGLLTLTENITYSYANDRLAQASQLTKGLYGLQTKRVSTYAYNAAGGLTQRVDVTTYPVVPATLKERPVYPDGLTETWTYTNGMATDYLVKAGGIETRPYTLKNGLVRMQSFGNQHTVYTYDNQNRAIIASFLVDGKENGRLEFAYAPAKLPESSLLPFKGFPTVLAPFGTPGVEASSAFYNSTVKGPLFKETDTQTQYALTGAGYVRTANEVSTYPFDDPNNASYQIKTTRTYSYDGSCD